MLRMVILIVCLVAGAGTMTGLAQARLEVMESTIPELQKAMTEGRVTSKQLVEAYQARIAAYDKRGPRLGAIVMLNPNAIRDAEMLDQERRQKGVRGPLHGIPVILKDNYDTAGMRTTGGTIALATLVPEKDGFQVRKLREAGAVILAKATMHELASGITNISSITGQTRNPYDPERNPGGSSGGTGAAVAASFAAVGMGSDTCGSIRIPAAHNNLVGLRPTKGLSSISGIIPLSVTQDVGGPLARTVTDLAIVLDATIGEDPDDPATRLSSQRPRFGDSLMPDALRGRRFGLLKALFGDQPEDQEVSAVVMQAVDQLKAAGAEVVDVTIPSLDDLLRNASVIDHEFKEDLAAYLERVPNRPVSSLEEIVQKGLMHVQLEVVMKRRAASRGRNSDDYRIAIAKRQQIREAVERALRDAGAQALVYPTIRRKAARIGDPQQGSNCQLSATSGLPAISMPAGYTDDGLPVGLEMIGASMTDDRLVAFAYSFEQATHHRRPPALTPPLSTGVLPVTWSGEKTEGRFRAKTQWTFDPSSNLLSYQLTLSGTSPADVLFANIHRGADGQSGPVIAIVTTEAFSRISGSTVLSDTDRRNLATGSLYFSVGLRAHPLGALRLQLAPPPRATTR